MKRLMTLTLMIALLLIPIGIAAQKNVVKAIDHFVSNKSYAQYITPSVSRENDSRTGNPIAYCYHYTFEIPRSKQKALADLRAAFYEDMPQAYSTLVKMSGNTGGERMRVSYGARLEKSVLFGTRQANNYLVMAVADPIDSLHRFVYALVWNENKATDKLTGSIYKIYSKNPRMKANRQSVFDNFTIDFNADEYRAVFDSLGNLYRDLPKNLDEKARMWMILSDKIWPKNLSKYRLNRVFSFVEDSVKTDLDFLHRFTSLRTAYKMYTDKGNLSLKTGIVNKLLRLCKEHGYLLSPHLREVCIAELRNMQSSSKDKFLIGLLDDAILKLK